MSVRTDADGISTSPYRAAVCNKVIRTTFLQTMTTGGLGPSFSLYVVSNTSSTDCSGRQTAVLISISGMMITVNTKTHTCVSLTFDTSAMQQIQSKQDSKASINWVMTPHTKKKHFLRNERQNLPDWCKGCVSEFNARARSYYKNSDSILDTHQLVRPLWMVMRSAVSSGEIARCDWSESLTPP